MEEGKAHGVGRLAQGGLAVLRAALALRDQKPKLSPEALPATESEQRLDALIDEKRRLTDPDPRCIAKRRRQSRKHGRRFLYVEGLDAANNQADTSCIPRVSHARPWAVITEPEAPRHTRFWPVF